MSYKVFGMTLGPIATNCYCLEDDKTGQAIMVDATGNIDKLMDRIEANGAKPIALLLTHAHFDHIDAVDKVRNRYPDIKVYIGENDAPLLSNPMYNLSVAFMDKPITVKADETVCDGQVISLMGLDIKCIEVPGHTIGGMCYYIDYNNKQEDGSQEGFRIIFDGDTLFNGSIGRSDFPTGDGETLINSIREKLLSLPEDTVVLPGHDSKTTIGKEKEDNFYFN
ncbi:MAG: MBL fold metallo-hydrolase [Eubacterium sp.]|nr:MBL fold metallo-hydrolase [Eubacterium sp.]